MDSNTKTSDSPTTDYSVATKGFTQIALGAAAGAFVAMRMNRTTLLLTAGLAYAYWKKNQPILSDDSVAEPIVIDDLAPSEVLSASLPEKAYTAWQAPEAPIQEPFQWATKPVEPEPNLLPASSLQPFFKPPIGLVEPEAAPPVEAVIAPSDNAWADLRAAIAPVITGPVEEKTESSLTVSQTSLGAESEEFVASAISVAASIGDMEVCLPSSPMVPHTMDEAEVMPDDWLMNEQADFIEEGVPQTLLFEARDELNPTPQPLQPTETLIVSKSATQPIYAEATSKDASLNAPVVVPRDWQARKSFFDWLRG
jgi:hypothetical protein